MSNAFKVALVISAGLHLAVIGGNWNLVGNQKNIQLDIIDEEKNSVDMILPEIKVLGQIRKIKPVESKEKQILQDSELSINKKIITKGEMQENMFRYEDMVLQKIQAARKYPYTAKRQGIEGTSVIGFNIEKSGEVSNVRLLESSGFDILDYEATATIERAVPFPEIPKELNTSSLEKTVSIVFRLRQ
jgi:TonB family protein